MFDKVAIIGTFDLIFPFKAMGIKTFSPQNLEEAKRLMKKIKEEKYGFCLLDENLFQLLKEELEDLSKEFCPVVVGVSDYRKITSYLEEMMGRMAIKATGSDSLIKRGEDEAR
ncbi:MAG: V-type ATP synthase subunit F [Candidatus Aminicenantales bacterium]